MEKKRDTAPSNLYVSGKDWAAMRKRERANFKRRVIEGIERMKWPLPDELSMTELGWKQGENEMLEGAIRFVKSLRV